MFSFFALASTATPTNLAKVVREISFPTPPPASHLRAAHWVEDVDDDVELVVQGGAIFRNLTKAVRISALCDQFLIERPGCHFVLQLHLEWNEYT